MTELYEQLREASDYVVTEAGRDAQHRFAAIIDHLLHDLANTAD